MPVTREELGDRLHDLIGELMLLGASAESLGEVYVSEHLDVARSFVVAAAQRMEPPLARLVPMPPTEGPPLPKGWGIRW